MYKYILKIFMCLLFMKMKVSALISTKIIYQRDISELCKRRVIPSVFLGQHVVDANSQVIQFSQLEYPYSCSLSIRAEAGSNIIMVLQVQSEDILLNECALNRDQLIVYELGETFGGYWGPISDGIMKGSDKNYTKYYTLKTTTTTKKRTIKKKSTTQKEITKATVKKYTAVEQEYITIDVPIVNVSGYYQLGPQQRDTANSEDLFNYIYDVTPRNGVEYETSIMPLVQFSIRENSNGLYDLDYDSKGLTMDPRLIYNTLKKKISSKRYWKINKRYRYGTKNTYMFRKHGSRFFTSKSPYINKTPLLPTLDSKYFTNSWDLVDNIIKSINLTTVRSTVFKNESLLNILNKISNLKHNFSVYSAKNLSIYNMDITAEENTTVFKNTKALNFSDIGDKISTIDTSTTSSLSKLEQHIINESTLDLNESKPLYSLGSKNDRTDIHKSINLTEFQGDKENMTTDKFIAGIDLLTDTTIPSPTKQSIENAYLTGAMVGHESWENIVQAAPVMANVLNNTDEITNIFNIRKKRYVQSLEIDQSRPRNLTIRTSFITNRPIFDDLHDLEQMVELQDDEIGSRVALRYLRHYVGPALFNFCDHRQHSLRQMFIFNSSRIVLSINNFTLDRLTIILTPAQALPIGMSKCPDEQLECQVIGTRVCIDSLNACDNIPNCGSYDIYDEDRLTCGTDYSMQRSVLLAALTFIAVILIAAYITLFWLERCVSRVSDAFFVYTDSSENELYLDSIMRSPNDDTDALCNYIYHQPFFEDDNLYRDLDTDERKVSFWKKIFKACWRFVTFKKISTDNPIKNSNLENRLQISEPSRMFSYTQLELRKFGKMDLIEEGVQTGDNLKMSDLNHQENRKDKISTDSSTIIKPNRYDSELNLLKIARGSRYLLSQYDSFVNNTIKSQAVGTETGREMEIKNVLYDNESMKNNKTPVTCEIHNETKKNIGTLKHLRFDEELQMIPDIEDDLTVNSSTMKRLNNEDSDNLEFKESISSGRDFMRFWGSKGKKNKRKKLKNLL